MDKEKLKLARILITFIILTILMYSILDLFFFERINPLGSINIIIILITSLILIGLWAPNLVEIIWFIR